ncbi:MAG: phage capsid protein [Desulfovibrio sp.]
MSTTIDQVFVTTYDSEVKNAYQQMNTKLRKTVYLKTGVVGSKARFQKIGKGNAVQKTRHGVIPVMNATHSAVEAVLEDWYAPDYSDMMDEIKTNIDERKVLAQTGAAALGRKVDSLIIDAMDLTTKVIAADSLGLTEDKISRAIEQFADVSEGEMFAAVGPHQWEELMAIDRFVNAQYVGDEYPMLKNTEARLWRGIMWMRHTGLPLKTGTRSCYLYHKRSLGLAEGQEIESKIDFIPEKDAHFINTRMSAGAVLIDDEGCVRIDCVDNAPISHS